MSSHPPVRLRLTLAALLLALAGTTAGAAVLLGSNQDEPTTVDAAAVTPTREPSIGGIDRNPSAAETPGTGMRLGVLDKEAAIREARRVAAAARQADALEALAVAQEEAVREYAALLAAAPDPSDAPTPPPSTLGADDDGGGGDDGGGDGLSMSEKLDIVAECESGGDPRAVSPDRRFWGAFQFLLSTWEGLGRTGNPIDHSYAVQKDAAADLVRAAGWDSWPTCGAQFS